MPSCYETKRKARDLVGLVPAPQRSSITLFRSKLFKLVSWKIDKQTPLVVFQLQSLFALPLLLSLKHVAMRSCFQELFDHI